MILVVTGGCGFVGLNLIHRLLADGVEEIRLVDNLTNASIDSLTAVLSQAGDVRTSDRVGGPWTVETVKQQTLISLVVEDVGDAAAAERVCRRADAVVHLAAQTGVPISLERPREDVEQNVIGSLNYLEACRLQGVPRFIVASSMAVLGEAEPPQSEDLPNRPLSPYGASKAAIEGYCSAYYHSFGLKSLALRFANVYGPFAWRKGSVVAAFCKRGLAGEPLIVDGDGEQSRDFVLAEDLSRVIAGAVMADDHMAEASLTGQPVNVATGRQSRVVDLAYAIQACFADLGIRCEIEFGPAREVDTRVSAPDTGRLQRLFPDLAMRELDEGLPDTVRWFHENWPPRGIV